MKNFWIIFLLLTSCVSVKLEKPQLWTKAKNYSLVEPAKFERQKRDGFDHFWIHKKSGNVISLQTMCGDQNDPSLSFLLQKSLEGINNLKRIKKESIRYNQRSALKTLYTGSVDGIEISLSTLVFKKNHCNYTLNYFGITSKHPLHEKQYQSFLTDFKVR